MCYNAFSANGIGQAHITDLVTPTRETHSRSLLISAPEENYDVRRFNSEFGLKAFSGAAPSEWNTLRGHIKTTVDKDNFKRALKTHYFKRVYNC